MEGLGDLFEILAKPAARVMRLDCLEPGTGNLKPESDCAKRRDKMNKKWRFKKKGEAVQTNQGQPAAAAAERQPQPRAKLAGATLKRTANGGWIVIPIMSRGGQQQQGEPFGFGSDPDMLAGLAEMIAADVSKPG